MSELRNRIVREATIRAEGDGDELPTRLTITVSTENPVRVWGVDEVLSHKRDAVDLSRFKAGAPFLADHDNSIRSILGRIEKPRIKDRELLADVVLADTEAARTYAALVRDDMSSKISVGFRVETWKKTREGDPDEGIVREETAIRWMPLEASAVAVPADFDAEIKEFRYADEPPKGADKRATEMAEETTTAEEETTAAETQPAPQVRAQPSAEVEAAVNSAIAARDVQVRQNNAALLALGEQYEARGCEGASKLAGQAIRDGKPMSWLRDEIDKLLDKRLEDLQAGGEVRRRAQEVGLSNKQNREFSLVKLIRHLAEPGIASYREAAGLEIEACKEAREINQKIEGYSSKADISLPMEFYNQPLVRSRAQAEYIAKKRATTVGIGGTPAAGGANELVETLLASESFIEYLYNDAMLLGRVMELPGLSGNVDIPRRIGTVSTSWVAETNTAGEADADGDYDTIELVPHKMWVSTAMSHTSVIQTDPGIEALTRYDHAMSKRLKSDAGIYEGTGANKEPTGILNVTGINSVTAGTDTNGIEPTDKLFATLFQACADGNAIFGDHMLLMSYAMRFKLQTVYPNPGAAGDLWNNGRPFGFPAVASNQVGSETRGTSGTNGTSRITACSPSQIIWASWGSDDIQVDPFSLRNQGLIRLSCIAHHDVQLRHPKSVATRRYVKHAVTL